MFDEEKANRAVRFIELLKHTGDFHGQSFDLLPWQRKVTRDVFGTMNARGVRQYRNAYIEMSKKNGKSEFVGALGNLHLFNRNEPNGEIYGCAGDRSQASIVFNTSVEMILQEPSLAKRVKIRDSYKQIENIETGTIYKVLSAESYTKHGYRPSIVLFDELHVQPNRDLWDTMTKGSFLARKQPLLWVITTAGDDPDRVSIGYEIHEKAEAIIKAREAGDPSQDIPTWYPIIYAYNGDDIYNEENWAKANPSLGKALQIEDLRELAAEAKLHKADERTFRWLNLNQWITTKLTTWLPIDLFDTTVSEWDRAELLGKDCYIGMDLSATVDLSAIALVFPPQEGFDEWRVIWDCWIPEDGMSERVKVDHVPYDVWARDAWITPTSDKVIDYTKIKDRILECRKLYNVIELDADVSFATMLLQELGQEGMTCVDIPQTYQSLTSPMNLTEVLLRRGKMTHENNPVARWAFGNTSISKNGNAQIKYVKEHRGKSVDRTKRIDLIAALVIAMARASMYGEVDMRAIMEPDWGM
jgi:phage terminase large subunit-like protein